MRLSLMQAQMHGSCVGANIRACQALSPGIATRRSRVGSVSTRTKAQRNVACRASPFAAIIGEGKGRRNVACRASPVAAALGGTSWVHMLAHILGYCVLAGSLLRSVPQIVRIVKSKSVKGLSLTAQVNELLSYSITCAYNIRSRYPFSTWGDVLSCWVQDIAIMALFFIHRPVHWAAASAISLFAAGSCVLLMTEGLVSMSTLAALQGWSILIVAFGSRVPQIVLNFRQGHTGELSFTTCLLNTLGNRIRVFTTITLALSCDVFFRGNLIRVFTTITLTGDLLLLASSSLQLVLNTTLALQCVQNALRKRDQGAPGTLLSNLL